MKKSSDNQDEKASLTSPNLYFGVDSQIIGELGERLVTNDYIALSELIKNAYDADSSEVKIELNNITKSKGGGVSSIVITDKGHGMTFEEVERYWMTIATSNKLENPVSHKYGRPKTGNKGVGRFACQKLASVLVLESVSKVTGGYEKTIVTFRWDDFEPGLNLDKIPCEYTQSFFKKGKAGVTLNLIGLKDAWTVRDYNMFQKSVALISVATPVRRDEFEEDVGFSIAISNDEFDTNLTLVGDEILGSGWGTLSGRVLADGTLSLKLASKDSDRETFRLENYNKQLSGLRFVIYIIPGDSKYDYIEARRNISLLTKKIRGNIWEHQGGIKVYRDSFRIYPYGEIESGDDWLGIARDVGKRRSSPSSLLNDVGKKFSKIHDFNYTRSMLNHPSAQAHIGSVYIEGNAVNRFEPKMDREGFVGSESLKQLKILLRLSTDWSALHYEAFIREKVSSRNEILAQKYEEASGVQIASKKERIENAIEFVRESAKTEESSEAVNAKSGNKAIDFKKTEADTKKKENKERFEKAVDYIDSQFDEYAAELDTLRSVASTAPLMFVFSHEVKGIVTGLLNHSSKLRDLAKKYKDSPVSGELISMADQAKLSVSRYGKLVKLFDVFSDSQNFDNKKAKVKPAIHNIVDGFDFLLSSFDITVEISEISPILKISKLNEAQIYSLIINALSNSIKAVIVKNTKRKIRIDVDVTESSVVIVISDTGVGLKKSEWTNVFKAFESDPEGKIYSVLSNTLADEQLTTLGKGSGLGLHIIKNIIDDTGGKVSFISPSDGWKCCLKMEIPK